MAQALKAGGTALPAPVEIKSSEEIIWSSRTGRSAGSGKLIGDVIAEKKTVAITWGVLTEVEVETIQNAMKAGFFTFSLYDCGDITITVYRGTLEKEHLGYIGDGTYYYKSVSVSVIEQ